MAGVIVIGVLAWVVSVVLILAFFAGAGAAARQQHSNPLAPPDERGQGPTARALD